MGVNLKELAAELKLSPSTVSRALNDSYEISEATKQKVVLLAKELDYQPNPFARSLRENKSKTIAVGLDLLQSGSFNHGRVLIR